MSLHSKIHVGFKQLGIEEEDRRDLYERVTGLRTSKGMTFSQQKAVVKELERLGFNPVSNGSRRRLEGKYAPKLQALWIACWNLGIVRNKSDEALTAFVKRQAKVDATRFLRHKEDADKVIEALKGMMASRGRVDWTKWDQWEPLNGCRIAMAQIEKLYPHDGRDRFWQIVCETGGKQSPNQFQSEGDWIPVMNALGIRIRAMK